MAHGWTLIFTVWSWKPVPTAPQAREPCLPDKGRLSSLVHLRAVLSRRVGFTWITSCLPLTGPGQAKEKHAQRSVGHAMKFPIGPVSAPLWWDIAKAWRLMLTSTLIYAQHSPPIFNLISCQFWFVAASLQSQQPCCGSHISMHSQTTQFARLLLLPLLRASVLFFPPFFLFPLGFFLQLLIFWLLPVCSCGEEQGVRGNVVSFGDGLCCGGISFG